MFKKFYQHWIKNSINRSFVDKIFFYIKENDKILGFVTFKNKTRRSTNWFNSSITKISK